VLVGFAVVVATAASPVCVVAGGDIEEGTLVDGCTADFFGTGGGCSSCVCAPPACDWIARRFSLTAGVVAAGSDGSSASVYSVGFGIYLLCLGDVASVFLLCCCSWGLPCKTSP
jgi:hypothetical protein